MPTGPLFCYDNRLLDAVPVASSTAAGFDVLNLRDARAYTFWKPAAMPATVTVDCGSSKTADSLAVYGHNLFTTGCTIEVRKSTDNFAANDVLVATHTPTDDKQFVVQFTSTSSRYWRLRVLTGSAPTIAIAMIGNKLEVPAGVREGFDPIGRQEISQFNRSVKGHALGIVTEFAEWTEDLTFELVTWSWVRDTWVPAWEAWLRSEPFIFAWNPDTYPKESYLIVRTAGFKTPHKAGSYTDLSLQVTGVIPE